MDTAWVTEGSIDPACTRVGFRPGQAWNVVMVMLVGHVYGVRNTAAAARAAEPPVGKRRRAAAGRCDGDVLGRAGGHTQKDEIARETTSAGRSIAEYAKGCGLCPLKRQSQSTIPQHNDSRKRLVAVSRPSN